MIFVVGNSRSGTTMLATILGSHSRVFMFQELHFFEQLWTTVDRSRLLGRKSATRLAARLLSRQREGILKTGHPDTFLAEASDMLSARERWEPSEVFAAFLAYEAQAHGKQVACDHTPRNVYYLREILAFYPDARIIVMVRDPRDVLASQKRKWQMRFRGYNEDPLPEALRLKINYHPITTSLLWNAAVGAGDQVASHAHVRLIRFEDLVCDPDCRVAEICEFLQLPYEPGMLAIPQVNSSYERPDSTRRGLNAAAAGQWQRGALTSTEIFLCERLTRRRMAVHGYAPANARPRFLRLVLSLVVFPLKAGLALLFNLGKTRSLGDSIRRRFGTRA